MVKCQTNGLNAVRDWNDFFQDGYLGMGVGNLRGFNGKNT